MLMFLPYAPFLTYAPLRTNAPLRGGDRNRTNARQVS